MPFTSKKGPAFIWTLNFSADDHFLSVGCWNATASLYAVNHQGGSSARLDLVAIVPRDDRVYATDLDETGRNMVVAGRDSKVALYDMSEAVSLYERKGSAAAQTPTQQTPVWEVQASDFIYSVTLSADLEYCCFGGTGRKLWVVDGRTGAVIFAVPFQSTVWAVNLVSMPDGTRLAVGGESATLSLWDLGQREVEMELPCDGEIYSICLSKDSLCYTNGRSAAMYGAGGTSFAWHDRPSYSVLTDLMTSLASDEATQLRCMEHIVERHPSVVNMTSTAHDPESGKSLLHWVVAHSSSSRLLERLLKADCWLGLLRDSDAQSLLKAAVDLGKWAQMRLLLKALTERRFLNLPKPMRVVSESFPKWANKFPADFLQLIGTMPLQPEPEVLGGLELNDVKLPRMLVRGSSWRCPRSLWMSALEKYQTTTSGQTADPAAPGGSGSSRLVRASLVYRMVVYRLSSSLRGVRRDPCRGRERQSRLDVTLSCQSGTAYRGLSGLWHLAFADLTRFQMVDFWSTSQQLPLLVGLFRPRCQHYT